MRRSLVLGFLAFTLVPLDPAVAHDLTPTPGLAPATVENQLVFTRQDGSVIQFPAGTQSWVWCGEYEEGTIATPALHILTYDPQVLVPGWTIDVVLADVTLEQPFQFPSRWTWPDPDSAEVFILDPPNEAATDTEDATGSLVFHALDCGPGGSIDFSIDAIVGSEFGNGPWIRVQGDFRADLTGAPVPAAATTWGSVKAIYR